MSHQNSGEGGLAGRILNTLQSRILNTIQRGRIDLATPRIQIPEELWLQGHSLAEDFGLSETAFERKTAIEIVKSLNQTNVTVIGGDVYLHDSEGIRLAYENWSCESTKHESPGEFATRSRAEAVSYIKSYHASMDANPLFVLVLGTVHLLKQPSDQL